MFKELKPLLRQRSVVATITRLEDDTIRVNIIPKKLAESENDALTTPISVTGTADYLDAELPAVLTQYVGSHLELGNTLESAKATMAAAAKAAKAEAKSKTGGKAESPKPEVSKTEPKKINPETAKAPEPKPKELSKTPSLFEFAAPAPTPPLPPSRASHATEDEVEIVSGADDEEAGANTDADGYQDDAA